MSEQQLKLTLEFSVEKVWLSQEKNWKFDTKQH